MSDLISSIMDDVADYHSRCRRHKETPVDGPCGGPYGEHAHKLHRKEMIEELLKECKKLGLKKKHFEGIEFSDVDWLYGKMKYEEGKAEIKEFVENPALWKTKQQQETKAFFEELNQRIDEAMRARGFAK